MNGDITVISPSELQVAIAVSEIFIDYRVKLSVRNRSDEAEFDEYLFNISTSKDYVTFDNVVPGEKYYVYAQSQHGSAFGKSVYIGFASMRKIF